METNLLVRIEVNTKGAFCGQCSWLVELPTFAECALFDRPLRESEELFVRCAECMKAERRRLE